MKKIIFILTLLIIFIGCSFEKPSPKSDETVANLLNGDFEKGLEAYGNSDFKLALKLWNPLIRNGDGRAQFRIAKMYHDGRWKLVNDRGETKFEIIDMNFGSNQHHRSMRRTESSHLFKIAYETNKIMACQPSFFDKCIVRTQVDSETLYALGEIYSYYGGIEVRNGKKAVDFYEKAADKGNSYAQYALGKLYNSPDGSYFWDIFGQFLPTVSSTGQNSNSYSGLHDDVVAQDKVKAENFFRKSAKNGNVKAQIYLGNVYSYGINPKDMKQAIFWYKKAAKQKASYAQKILAKMYLQGTDMEADFQKAADLYREAHKNDLLFPTEKANIIEKELVDRKRLADKGDAKAQYEMGLIYNNHLKLSSNDLYIPRNQEKAFSWYEKSAEQNYAPAQFRLGQMYRYGQGIEPNSEKSIYWLDKARKAGYKNQSE